MDRKRRRHAVFYSPATVVGGAEKYLSQVLPEFARTWDVTLFCPVAPELSDWIADLHRRRVRVVRYDLRRQRFRTYVRMARSFRAADLLHLNLITPPVAPFIGVLGWLSRVPLRTGTQHLVLTPEDLSHYRIKQAYLRVLAGLHRYTLHWTISPSEYSAKVLMSRFGFPAARVHVIHHGIDLDADGFNLEPRPRTHAPASESCWPILGCVGWVQERKGQRLIVEALPALSERFPTIHAVFVGNGPDIASLRGRARALGVEQHVSFVGHRSDVASFYRQMDLFVLPSRAEGLPYAVIEAMAHRLPVIASDIPSLREVIGDTGILLRTRSPEAIVEAVLRCFAVKNPQALGAAARARVEREFRLQRMIDDTLRLIEVPPATVGRDRDVS